MSGGGSGVGVAAGDSGSGVVAVGATVLVGAAVGLGQRQPAADLTGGEFRQVEILLRLGALPGDTGRHDQMAVDDAAYGHPDPSNPLDDLGVGRRRKAKATVDELKRQGIIVTI